jgi:hypothetical protein
MELHVMVADMYVNLQVFQQLAAQIMDHHRTSQSKNVEFTTTKASLNDMQWWIDKNIYAPARLPCISEWERKVDYVSLDNFQQVGEKAKKDINNSLSICAQIHKEAHILTHKGHLPLIKALGKMKSDKQSFEDVELNMK